MKLFTRLNVRDSSSLCISLSAKLRPQNLELRTQNSELGTALGPAWYSICSSLALCFALGKMQAQPHQAYRELHGLNQMISGYMKELTMHLRYDT